MIHKYILDGPEFVINLPEGTRVLSTIGQGDNIVVYVVPGEGAPTPYLFISSNTGCPVPDGEFLGTVSIGPIVWHVFLNC